MGDDVGGLNRSLVDTTSSFFLTSGRRDNFVGRRSFVCCSQAVLRLQ